MPISNVTNEDCIDLMARYPDKFFDLAIVDPPYGIGESRNLRGGTHYGASAAPSKDYGKKDWDNKAPDFGYFKELTRVSKNQIIWGANHFGNMPPSTCWIVWDKLTGDNGYADCELAYTSFGGAVRKFSFQWMGMLQGNMKNKQERIHPTQKPYQLYFWLMQKFGEGKILDTHLGSGSSRIAAYKLGFDFWGCEIDKDYFEAQEKRFKEAINEPLFQTQPERIQAKLL